jgi:hypothetical protein
MNVMLRKREDYKVNAWTCTYVLTDAMKHLPRDFII